MHTGHIFAGAGGGILADLINGHRPTWAIEIDPYACRVLRERFPWLRVVEGDVRGVDFRALAHVDAICGGFPCQDISAAGTGVGITGERSGLFREIMRAIDDLRPDFVFLENSPRIRTRGRHVVIGELVARGYSWRDGILGAADVGAPHRRDRWWCLSANADGLRQLQSQGRIADERRRAGDCAAANPPPDACGDRLEEPLFCPGLPEAEREAIEAAARYTGARAWNRSHPDIRGVGDVLANRAHRIRCLGNGQVPLCAAVAWRLLGGPIE